MTPGQRLRAARTALGMSQAELGGLMGISRNYLADVERGRRNPSLTWLLSAAAALGCDPAELDDRLASHSPSSPSSRRTDPPSSRRASS